ncbi:MAG: hypothetical protein ACYDBB_04390 [Armatimonadota bacterium]
MATTPLTTISLRGATIVSASTGTATERLAAQELARYLLLLTGTVSPVTGTPPTRGTIVFLTSDTERAAALGTPVSTETVGEEGYRLRAIVQGVVVAALSPVGVLYGVYGLLEELGMGFYLGGETLPDDAASHTAPLPADLDLTQQPAFAIRGNMLHYNFLCGCTTWGLEDYKFYFDQLARTRCNLFLIHWYDGEPGAASEVDGEYLTGGTTPNSLTKPWGALASLRTAQYSFGTGEYFDEEIFSSPAGESTGHTLTEIKRSEAFFSEATRYGKRLGVRVAAGFEAPRGEPTDQETERNFRARVRQFLRRNPHIAYFALWQHESGGSVGSALPQPGSAADALFKAQYEQFAYLGNPMRVWEAIRIGRFAQIACEVLQEEAPHLPMVLVGWGGDRWMQFADYCLAYDKMLPAHVIFTCHENIIASIGQNVSTPWGQLPPERGRWAMPWVECDLSECWSRQPNVEILGTLAPDALRKGCQGLLTLHWRTRDVEEEAGYTARFAWDPTLTPDTFYRTLARHAFGPDQEEAMGAHLGTLQRLGTRWTGVSGIPECSRMRWTGFVPHIPFEITSDTPRYFLEMALRARDALAEVPEEEITNTDAGMFHLREEGGEEGQKVMDVTRPGVQEFAAAVQRLAELTNETDPERILAGLKEVQESILQVRPTLIHAGIPPKCHIPMDDFWIRLHYFTQAGGVKDHYAVLESLRSELQRLRDQYVAARRNGRLERLDYLLATMDFVMPFDRAAMLLASDELVDTALQQAATAREAGDAGRAAQLAADAYAQLLQAGMQDAAMALTRKLTTRCDFGVLTTVNVKPLPLYWETIGRLEEFLPAVPPREVKAYGDGAEVWLEWNRSPRAAGYHLYRRGPGETSYQRINKRVLSPYTFMFVDRPAQPGTYRYVVIAVDAQGWESPYSHHAEITPGGTPRIVAAKPGSVAEAGKPLPVRVTVKGECDIAAVRLHYRAATAQEWTVVEMPLRFRNSYHASIPAEAVTPGVLLHYVEAVDMTGKTSRWPSTAPDGLAWSTSVVEE